jgi:hypothetical protein
MPVPTIARIKAYSAADAPLSSAQSFLRRIMSFTPICPDGPFRGGCTLGTVGVFNPCDHGSACCRASLTKDRSVRCLQRERPARPPSQTQFY